MPAFLAPLTGSVVSGAILVFQALVALFAMFAALFRPPDAAVAA